MVFAKPVNLSLSEEPMFQTPTTKSNQQCKTQCLKQFRGVLKAELVIIWAFLNEAIACFDGCDMYDFLHPSVQTLLEFQSSRPNSPIFTTE